MGDNCRMQSSSWLLMSRNLDENLEIICKNVGDRDNKDLRASFVYLVVTYGFQLQNEEE